MSKVVRLTESDLNKLVKRILSEQVDPLYRPTWIGGIEGKRGRGPGGVDVKLKPYTVNMDGGLFKNGEDKIDTNSPQFKKGTDAIRTAILSTAASGGQTPTIQIIGGASAVGQKSGYDNKGLAQRRANNYYKIVKDMYPDVKFTLGIPVVGSETERGPKADAEQFVKLNIAGSETELRTTQSRDNTALNLNIGPGINKKQVVPDPVEKTWIVCFEVGDALYQKIKGKKNLVSAKLKK